MRTVVLGPPPPELTALIARRHELGLDRYDEVWDGEYHMAPMAHSSHGWLDDQLAVLVRPLVDAAGLFATGAFNLGAPDDFRVPDRGLHRVRPHAVWVPTAAVAVEIESPDDETWEKLPFYASRGVDEVLIGSADPRSVTCWRSKAGRTSVAAAVDCWARSRHRWRTGSTGRNPRELLSRRRRNCCHPARPDGLDSRLRDVVQNSGSGAGDDPPLPLSRSPWVRRHGWWPGRCSPESHLWGFGAPHQPV